MSFVAQYPTQMSAYGAAPQRVAQPMAAPVFHQPAPVQQPVAYHQPVIRTAMPTMPQMQGQLQQYQPQFQGQFQGYQHVYQQQALQTQAGVQNFVNQGAGTVSQVQGGASAAAAEAPAVADVVKASKKKRKSSKKKKSSGCC
eukprot:TRINITY_DN400_c0_g2_i1.p2 TRINITY_DN400_c0_g2~~TRINITY_DN400_c0_g2_i1.p2  ORF type:complete len:142 (+),score=36.84 TRINITY_DN400_c0_g2_i1:75-500(+)